MPTAHPQMSDSYGKIKVDEIENSGGTLLDLTTAVTTEATTSTKGYLSAADKTKLDGIEAGAEVNGVTSVNGSTGAVTIQGFSTANNTKLDGIEAGAQVNAANTVIDASYVATDENFTTADHTKLDGVEAGATADQTKADIDALNVDADTLDGQHGAYYTGYADTAVANLVDSSPSTLDTLNELAAALGDDPNFATTVTNSIGTKLPLAGGTLTGGLTGTTATFAGGALAIASSGNLSVNRTAGTNDVFNGKLNGTVTSTINADGSATLGVFPQSTSIGGNSLIKFNAASDANIICRKTDSLYNTDHAFEVQNNTGAVTASITGTGAATYAGTVTANAFSGDGSALTNLPAIENAFGSSAPSSPGTGDFWVDTTNDPPELKSYNGTAWIAVGSSGPTTSAPVINSVTLTEDDSSGDRFTSESFTVAVNMLDDGSPISQKGVKGKVVASFEQFPTTTAITARSENTTPTNVGSLSAQLNSTYYQWAFFNVLDPNTGILNPFGIRYSSGSNTDQVWRTTNDHETWQLAYQNITGVESSSLHTANTNRAGTHVNFWGFIGNSNKLMSIAVAGLLSGSPVKQTSHFLSTDTYHYWLSYSGSYPTLYRQLKNGSTDYYDTSGDQSQKINLQGMYQNVGGHTGCMGLEAASDSIVIFGRSNQSSNHTWYKEITDSNSLNWSNGTVSDDFIISNFNRSEMGAAVYHKGAVFIAYRGTLLKITSGASSATAITPLPSPGSGYSTTSYVTMWESPDGLLIAKSVTTNSSGQGEAMYYSSSNSGASWVSNYYPTITGQQTERFTPDVYTYGHRAQMRINQTNSYPQFKIQCIRLGYQDLTVTDGADLSSLNVGDAVKFSETAPPKEHGKIMSKTSNGNGTTTVRVRTFTTVNVGDTIQAVASTGSATSTRFLVIDVTGAVTSHQANDPGFVNQGPGTSHTITFPATFPTGDTPDVELPSGTTIQIDVQAVNSEASDTYPSNIVTPS